MTSPLDGTNVEARLYDTRQEDQAVDLLRDPPRRLRDDQLPWIDLVGRSAVSLRTLTVLSAILLPAGLMAGVLAMSFPLPFFEDPDHLWIALGRMVAVMIGTLAAVLARDRA